LLVVAGQAGVRRLDSPNGPADRTIRHTARVGPAALHLGEVPGEEAEGRRVPRGCPPTSTRGTPPGGTSHAQFRRAIAQANAIPTANVGSWQLVGPSNIGARLTDLVVDPTQPGTIDVSIASGGVWRSTEAGATFTSIWPDANLQAMGALARRSDGTPWAGTGEANPSGGGLTFFGNGV
jgi:hypothetical protein